MTSDINLKLDETTTTNTSISLHLLPFQVGESSTARVNNFFKIQSISQKATLHKNEQFDVLEASFRGRLLKGVKLPVPPEYQGLILRDSENSGYDAAVNDEEDQKNWTISGAFSSFTYWTREVSPTETDKLFKWLPWIDLSHVLHTNEGVVKDKTKSEQPVNNPPITSNNSNNNNNNNNDNDNDNGSAVKSNTQTETEKKADSPIKINDHSDDKDSCNNNNSDDNTPSNNSESNSNNETDTNEKVSKTRKRESTSQSQDPTTTTEEEEEEGLKNEEKGKKRKI